MEGDGHRLIGPKSKLQLMLELATIAPERRWGSIALVDNTFAPLRVCRG